jgi:hypothetical protein
VWGLSWPQAYRFFASGNEDSSTACCLELCCNKYVKKRLMAYWKFAWNLLRAQMQLKQAVGLQRKPPITAVRRLTQVSMR